MIEPGVWSEEQSTQYATMMLRHNIKNSNEEKNQEDDRRTRKKNYNNTF